MILRLSEPPSFKPKPRLVGIPDRKPDHISPDSIGCAQRAGVVIGVKEPR